MGRPRKKDPAYLAIQARRSIAPWPLRYPHALASFWDLAKGDHPKNAPAGLFYDLEPFFHGDELPRQLEETDVPLIPCVDGHNLMADNSIMEAAGADYKVPISPLFVKDLAGRVIYIGYGPEIKSDYDWRIGRNVTFPENCIDMPDDVEGIDMLENVFFTRFRALEMAFDFEATPSGEEDMGYGAHYSSANLYPYKLRPDTFYQDGWRLPQTAMVFARKKGINLKVAEEKAQDFMRKWRGRPEDQSYDDFYEENNGDEWFEELFINGCTIIPTVESCNGYAKVGRNFEIEDYWAGRVVAGLHEVSEKRDSDAPKGTILEVLEPGYVLAHKILPARVVVSNGSGYKSPNDSDPAPMVPNFNLPHTRTASNWEKIWVPTAPKHFEAPAIWGWDGKTGRFLQLKGPIWEPLHYHYASVNTILRSFRNTLPENPFVAEVPAEMKGRFYPVVAFEGFDTISQATRQVREEHGVFPISSIDRVRDGKEYANIGYHPLPMEYEVELDSSWFPEMSPNYRTGEMPNSVRNRIVPVITSALQPQAYVQSVTGPREADWLYDLTLLEPPRGKVEIDYPHLKRFLGGESDEEVMEITPLFLSHIPDKVLNLTAQANWYEPDIHTQIDSIEVGLFDEVFEMRERGLAARKLRHKLYRRYPGWYTVGLWRALPIETVMNMVEEYGSGEQAEVLQGAVAETAVEEGEVSGNIA